MELSILNYCNIQKIFVSEAFMLIIVIGCGKVGSTFANVLSSAGHDIVVVDNDSLSFSNLSPSFSGVTIKGVPIDEDVLRQAGIESADALAALTPDDNVNIMVCQVAKEIFKVPKVLARIFNPDREKVFHEFGLETICPTNITVEIIQSVILGETGVSRHSIGSNLFSFKYEALGKAKVGKKLGAISKHFKDVHIFGLKRGNEIILANDNTIINNGDLLVIAKKVD